MKSASFKLQFEQPTEDGTRDAIKSLAAEYLSADGQEDDDKALRAGTALVAGENIRKNLLVIYKWKLASFERFKLDRHLEDNTDEEIADATRLASGAETPRAAMAVLVGLAGVGIPVASAILTAMFPDRFTVIDQRAIEALGNPRNDGTIRFYLEYLKACAAIAVRCRVKLRTLDRALWQWGSN